MKTEIIDEKTLERAAAIIRSGGVVAVPTETVYGLAANGIDETAIERIYEAKGRPETKPISLFIEDLRAADGVVRDVPEGAYKLAETFFPGPLTLILKKGEKVPDILTAGSDTVGVRCPDNTLTRQIMRFCGVPLTGTSANISGMPDANDISDIMAYFDGKIPAAVDGGRCGGGVPSTVLDMTRETPRILRQGGVTKEQIEAVLGMEINV